MTIGALANAHVSAAAGSRARFSSPWLSSLGRGLCLGLSLSIASLSLSPATAVCAPKQAVSAADRAAAQALFDQGRKLLGRGKAEAACSRFEESQRLQSALGTQYHLADCYEAVGKTASAHALFLEIAARARDLGQTSREELARQRAAAVERKLVKLRITVSQATGQEIFIERDGSRVGRAQWGLGVPIDPGIHRIRAFGVGLVPWQTEIKVPPEPGVVAVSVPRLMSDGRPSFWRPTSRKVGAAAFGVGVASLGISTAFAVQARSKHEESNRAGCNESECPDTASLAIRNAARTAGNRATWALGVGVSGVAAGTALFFWTPASTSNSERESMRISPVAHARGGGLRVQGRF